MANKIYTSKTALTGGTATALDYIDGSLLSDGDIALVFVSGILYTYKLNGSSSAAESSPAVIAPDTNPGTKRWELQGVRNLLVGSDADGDMYYRAGGVLARLAKGAANLKMFMNAAGTAPEWATEFKIITATRDLTAGAGDVAYTGVGFKPAGFIMAGTASSNDLNEFTLGFAIGTGMANICLFPRAAPVWGMTTTRVVISERGASDGSKNQTAIVK
ncbi:MAG: hypothetical protein ACYDHW_10715, partial [Syntrophorhabdaceae bacterium]